MIFGSVPIISASPNVFGDGITSGVVLEAVVVVDNNVEVGDSVSLERILISGSRTRVLVSFISNSSSTKIIFYQVEN